MVTARPAMSLSCLCKTEGVKSPVVTEPAFLVHCRRQGYTWRVDLFIIICILLSVFILFSFLSRMSIHLSVGYKQDQLFTSAKTLLKSCPWNHIKRVNWGAKSGR